MTAQEKILDKGDLSQMFAFNAEPDEAQAQYTQQHQKETDFNYAMKGDTEDIGRIVTNASQEQHSESAQAKKKEKANATMRHLLEQQALRQDIDAGFEGMEQTLDDIENETEQLEAITKLLNEGDMDAARDYITSVTGEDASDMTDPQAQEWLINKGYEHIQNIEDLTEEYKTELKDQQERINKLPENSPERIAAEQKMSNIEDKYKMIAKHKQLPFEEAKDKLLETYNKSSFSVALKTTEEAVKADQYSTFVRPSKNADPFASAEGKETGSVAATTDNNDPFAKVAGNISDPFNEVASKMTEGEVALTNEDNALETKIIPSPLTNGLS